MIYLLIAKEDRTLGDGTTRKSEQGSCEEGVHAVLKKGQCEKKEIFGGAQKLTRILMGSCVDSVVASAASSLNFARKQRQRTYAIS